MEGIEISFPLAVCRDILEDPESRQWRFYEASISPGKDGKKTLGSLRARVGVSEPDQFMDLILSFPRNSIKCPAVRGKLRCRAEFVRGICEADGTDKCYSISETSKGSPLQRESETGADDQPRDRDKNKARDESVTLSSVRSAVRTGKAKQASDAATEAAASATASSRPSRRREKPSKYKDYVSTTDASKQTPKQAPVKTDTHNPELLNDETGDIQSQVACPDTDNLTWGSDDRDMNQAKQKRHQMRNLVVAAEAPTKQQKRVVRKYDKLIKNLQQASAQSGLEMLSVITGYRSDADSDHGETTLLGGLSETSNNYIHTQQKANENPRIGKSLQNATANTVEQGSRAAVESEFVDTVERPADLPEGAVGTTTDLDFCTATDLDNVQVLQSNANVACENGVKTLSKPTSNPSRLTSFPRKFPSSLTRTDVLLTKTSVTDSRKRPPSKGKAETFGEILSKYKKIQPAEKMTEFTSEEEFLDDDRDADYLPGKDEDESDSEFVPDSQSQSEDESRKKHKRKTWRKQRQSNEPGHEGQGPVPFPLSTLQVEVQQDGMHGAVLLGPVHVVSGNGQSGSPAPTQPPVPHSKNLESIPQPCQADGSNTEDGSTAHQPPRPPLTVAVADHDYSGCPPSKKPLFSSRALKTLVRPISLAQHISARVERVEEGDGSSLVTISGLNTKAGVGTTPQNMHLSLRLNHEGLPIAESLEDAMTDTIRCREKHRESYHLALTAEPSPAVHMDIADLAVQTEVVLTPSGHQHASQRLSKLPGRGRPRKHPLLTTVTTSPSSAASTETVESHSDSFQVLEVVREEGEEDSSSVVVQMTQDRCAQDGNNTWGEGGGEDQGEDANQQELLRQGLIGASFLPGEVVAVDDLTVENEEEVSNSQQRPVRKFCKYCLRMFPASVILYKHVRTVHSAYAASEGYQEYLEALRRDNRIKCPFCPSHRTLANEYKLRAHIADVHHGQVDDLGEVVDTVSHQCEVCQVHFHTLSELKAHATLLHNTDLSVCSQCPLVFVRDTSLVVHVREAHGGIDAKSYRCKTCDSKFDNKRLLMFHKRHFHGRPIGRPRQQAGETADSGAVQTNTASTPQTKKKSGSTATASAGVKSVGNGSKCPCCLAWFPDPQQVQDHRRQTHSGPIPVHCALCGTGYQSLMPMYSHLRHHLHDDPDTSLVRCPYCPLAMPSAEALSLVSHMVETHGEQFPHACHVCRQSFASVELLLVHLGQAHEIAASVVNSSPPDVPGSALASSSSSSSSSASSSFFSSSSSSALLSGSAGTLDKSEACSRQSLPPKGAENVPTLLDVDSDVLRSFPPEAQRRIRLIVQQGRRALLTINNGRGSVQRVSFGKVPTQPTSLPTTSTSPAACGGEEGAEDLHQLAKVDSDSGGAASQVPEDETQSAVESLLPGVNLAEQTDASATTSSIGLKAEAVALTETPGVSEQVEIVTGLPVVAGGSEVVADPATGGRVKTETGLYSGSSRLASEMDDVTGTLGMATEVEVVTGASDVTVLPTRIVLGEGMGGEEGRQGALVHAVGGPGGVDLRDLATLTVQTTDTQSLAMSAEDLLKLIKDSQSAGNAAPTH